MKKAYFGVNADAFVEKEFAFFDSVQDSGFVSMDLFEQQVHFCIKNLSQNYKTIKGLNAFFSNPDYHIVIIDTEKKLLTDYVKLLKKHDIEIIDTSKNNDLLIQKLVEYAKELGFKVKTSVARSLLSCSGSFEYAKNQMVILLFAKQNLLEEDFKNLWFFENTPEFLDSKKFIYEPDMSNLKKFDFNMFMGSVGYFALQDFLSDKPNIFKKFLEAEYLFKNGKLKNEKEVFLWMTSKSKN
jgi:hypothetical protein